MVIDVSGLDVVSSVKNRKVLKDTYLRDYTSGNPE